MKRYFLYMAIALAGLGCQRYHEEPQITIPAGKGAVQIALKINATTADVVSKATVTDPYVMTAEGLTVSVLQGDRVLQTWEQMSAMPPVLYLEQGSYILEVKTRGTREKVSAVPYYFGQTPFEIATGRVSSIEAAAALKSLVVSMTLKDGWAAMTPYKLSCFALDKPSESLFTTDNRAARLYIDAPFPYGLRVEGRAGNASQKRSVLVYENLTVGVYHNLTISDQQQ